MKIKQHGFGPVGIVVIILIAVTITAAIWLFLDKQNSGKGNATSTVTKSASDNIQPRPASQSSDSVSNLPIMQWSVRLNLRDADKVSYDYSAAQKGQTNDQGTIDSSIGLRIKPEFLQDKTCSLGLEYQRYSSMAAETQQYATKLGDYYYRPGGSPYQCSNSTDEALKQRITDDYKKIQRN